MTTPAVAAVPMRTELAVYLRALWGVAPALLPPAETQADDTRDADTGPPANPCWSNLGLHLPLQAPPASQGGERRWYRAAAAHAAAHLVYSRHRFDAASLKPITRALVGLLEDARVEWLACRELPGLRALWLPFHAAAASDACDFESLMRRLANALLDPSHDDCHPWVAKGRALFFADPDGRTLRLRRAADVREAASRLGNDIGQMRLSFNPRLYSVAPGYRDDNAVLWQAPSRTTPVDGGEGDGTTDVAPATAASSNDDAAEAVAQSTSFLYPEWDRLIGRHRARWCTVQLIGTPSGAGAEAVTRRTPRRGAVVATPTFAERQRRLEDGEQLDLDAALQARIDQRLQRTPDPRVHEALRLRPARTVDLWLLDLSASATGAQIDHARDAALLAADLAARQGNACAIDGFRSCGRNAVRYLALKGFEEALDARVRRRLAGLQGALSTRLGAALRHAVYRLQQQAAAPGEHVVRRLFVVTDGEPYDIDIHDPRYLVEDACRAVAEARRAGIEVTGVGTQASMRTALQRLFGRRGCWLPRAAAEMAQAANPQPRYSEWSADGVSLPKASSLGGVAFMR